MEEREIIQHFDGKTIFITGASGFLAKIFIEKILRVQPNLKKLYLLIRSTVKRSIEQRLKEEVVDNELFRVVRDEWGGDFKSVLLPKIVPISGDVSRENLGIIDSEITDEMRREIDIIVNSAAITKFDERYDVAFGVNVLGPKHVQDFARKCGKLDMLLHVSTAYVHGTRTGLISEKPFHMGETLDGTQISNLNIDVEMKIIEEKLRALQTHKPITEKEIGSAMKDLGTERAMLHGWPNTYVFTKAMGEMMLENFKEKANLVIIRPTIITSTYREPFPGWTEGLRTLDSVFAAFGKGKMKFFVGDPEATLDTIPGDMVVNCMIAAIATRSNDKRDLFVYHIGSSRRNPMKYEALKRLMHRYLTEHPLVESTGKPIKIGQPTILNTMASFQSYIAIHYLPLLKVLKVINLMFCNHFEHQYTKARRRISHTMRLAELYKPYLFSKTIFDDVNTENLRMAIRGSKETMDVLNFDPNCIQWDEYFLSTHFPGLVKYVLN